MKKLYALAETHFFSPSDLKEFCEKRFSKSEPKFIATLRKIGEERFKRIGNFIRYYKPNVFFYEGLNDEEIRAAGYQGRTISLDAGCEAYYKLRDEIGKFFEYYVERFRGGGLEEFSRGYEEFLLEWHSRSGIGFRDLLEAKRETFWAKVISENYEEPAALKCGPAHLLDGDINNLWLFLHYFLGRIVKIGNHLLLLPSYTAISYESLLLRERRKGRIGILKSLLKYKGIELELKDFLIGYPAFK